MIRQPSTNGTETHPSTERGVSQRGLRPVRQTLPVPIDPFPHANRRERAEAIFDALVAGAIPVVGDALVELARQTFGRSMEVRHDAWLVRLAELLNEIEGRVGGIEAAFERQGFVTAFMNASQVAMAEHLEAKLDMLKAVLVNAAIGPSSRVADALTLRYIRWIDELEPEHIEFLAAVDANGYEAVASWDELDDTQRPVRRLVVNDLTQLGLLTFDVPTEVHPASLSDLITYTEKGTPPVTDEGRRFLRWLRVV